MFLLTKFYPFNFDKLHGYTSKIFPKVIISSIIKENNSKENIIINFSKILNTIFHEQQKHYIKTIVHYNFFRFKLYNDLESDNKLNEESLQKFLQIVKKKKELTKVHKISKDEMEELTNSDGGDKLEIIQYGQKLQRLYIKAAINLLKIEVYQTDISNHLCNFIEDNIEQNYIINLDDEWEMKIFFI